MDIELHNFSPVVEEVVITCEGRTIWQAFWTADGLEPDWHNPVDLAVLPDQTLDVMVVFSEPMDTTSVTVTAGVLSPYNDITASDAGLNWSWTNCPEEPEYKDTWHGVFNDLTGCTFGRMTLSIQAQDQDANDLTDPSVTISDGRYNDIHHSFSVMGSQPGWPVTLSAKVYGSPVLGDLDDDGDLDVVIQSTDGWVHALSDSGNTINGHWPRESGIWGVANVYSTPSIVDLDGDGDNDILAVKENGCNAWDVATGSSISGWPVTLGFPSQGYYPTHTSPAIGDVDNDGHPEVVICRCLSDTTPSEHTVFLFEHTGWDATWSVNLDYPGGESVASTPAIGDVSSNHSGLEIVVCTSDDFGYACDLTDQRNYNSGIYLLDPDNGDIIWETYFNCHFYASPAVADIDNDGVNEIIVGTCGGSYTKKVLVLNGNTGAVEHTWNVGGWVMGPVAISDINSDGCPDVVASVNGGTVECWSGADYLPLVGFPVTVGSNPSRGPSIADIDGDFKLEIVVGTASDSLYAIKFDGTICSGYPVACGNGVYGQVALGNIDDDDGLEMIFADDSDPVLYCYDLGAGSFPAMMPWRQFQHDSWHSGFYNADNTIPEPPTNLSGEITYTGTGCEVDLEWDLSVNDPCSSSPEEPTDVIAYMIMRRFSSSLRFRPIQKVQAGDSSYTDIFSTSPMNSQVFYAVVALDGTNESAYSNIIQFSTSPSGVISLGCSVIEEFSDRIEPRTTDELSHNDRTSISERTFETIPTAALDALPSIGNPGCLTDGSVEVCYEPSPGADAIVIDLGEECTVTSVIPERISDTSLDTSARRVESVRTDETVHEDEFSLIIEVAGSDREFYLFAAESPNSSESIRYVRIRGASGLSEVSVYGERESEKTSSSVEITRSVEDAGWMFTIPVVEYSEEALVKIFDVSGRMIWSGQCESGSILHWDGYTDDRTPVPNGVYLLHCSIGSEVSTGSFVVRRE
ncbi:MAG: FG-GAP-like repeat-containing protein [Candidatus Aegiribacteria sp.]|nr:FG-GAP-like repeat-containing protein [Candidatus Aegiribacteria sp.]